MKTFRASMVIIIVLSLVACFVLAGCSPSKVVTSIPVLSEENGWTVTLHDDFTKINDLDKTVWRPSPHGARHDAYWCDQTISLSAADGLIIDSLKSDSHYCPLNICPKSGTFTGGVDSYNRSHYIDDNGNLAKSDEMLFSQAFGYYEATVKVPRGTGMWSAFWLQSTNIGKIGNSGRDGTEIDIYESSFHSQPTKTGSALHYDAYELPYYRLHDKVTDVDINQYDNQYHTYSLLWTPTHYSFFIDGKHTWTTSAGGVSRVPEFLRLTVEIKKGIGPYGMPLTEFSNATDNSNKFAVKEVKVYQNSNYIDYIMSDDDFEDKVKLIGTSHIILYISLGICVVLAAITIGLIVKKMTKNSRKSVS